MGNFVRGGQLFLHALRMFHQVIKPVFIWSFVFWLIVTALLSYKRLNYIHMGSVLAYFEACGWKLIFINDIDITIPTVYGNIIRKSGDVIHLPIILDNINYTFHVIEISAQISLVLTSVLAITIAWYLAGHGKEKTSTNIIRGSELGEFKKVRNEILTANNRAAYNAYSIANMFYPVKGEMKHTVVLGTTGVGKTVLISDIVAQIRERGDRAIIFDTKGCYIEWFYDKARDHILNPYDARSEKWNILKEISHPGQIKSIVDAFIPRSYSQDKVWNEAARVVSATIIDKLYREKPHLSNRQIADILLKQDVKSMSKLLKGTYAQSVIDPAASDTAAGVMFNLSTYLNGLGLVDGTKRDSFSIREWVLKDQDDSFLFISTKSDSEGITRSLQTAWWEVAFKSMLSRERASDKKIWIILDEFASLQQIPSLLEAMSKTREYGCCFVLGFQNIAQIEQIYGRDSKTLNSLCNTRCIFKTPDPETARWASQNIGEQEYNQVNEGLSYGAHQMRDGVSVNKQTMYKSVVLPSEVQNLKDLELYIQLPGYSFVRTQLQWQERNIHNLGLIECERSHKNMKTDTATEPNKKVHEGAKKTKSEAENKKQNAESSQIQKVDADKENDEEYSDDI